MIKNRKKFCIFGFFTLMTVFKKNIKLILLLFPIYFTLFNGNIWAVNEQLPRAHKGVIDLRNQNFNSIKSIPLNGEWEFYWNKLLTPADFPSTTKPAFPPFPSKWNSLASDSNNISNIGYATYRLKILLDSTGQILALEIPAVYTAYQLWLNGKLFSVNGKTGTDKKSTIPYWLPVTKTFVANTNEIELILQISNFEHSKGGISESIFIGNATYLTSLREKRLSITLLLTGALIMGGLFFLGLFMFGRRNREILYFSLFTIIYSYRVIGTDLYFLHSLFPNIDWHITIRLEYLTLFLSIFFFMRFLEVVYPKETSKIMAGFLKATTLILVILVLLFPPDIFTLSVDPFLVSLLIYIIYGIFIIVNAARRKRAGSQYAIISFLFLFVVVALQVLNYLGILPFLPFVYFIGYILFFFFQSLILSFRFADYFKKATERAELGARTKAEFMATMSHEIRTPMNGVIGMTSLLQQTNLNKEQQEYVETIRISSENLLTVINDILDFSKIEQGKMILEENNFNLINSIEEVLTLLGPVAAQKNLELLFNKSNDVPNFIIGDEKRLKQILINLINNAIKFTVKGEVLLSVSVKYKTDENIELLFTVIDTGIGIPKDKIDTLFRSFTQIDSSISRKYEGTGLGLTISKNLVEMMGGEINVESEEGKGSVFSFTIKAGIGFQHSTDIIASLNKENFKNRSILILDDNKTSLNILRSKLKEQGALVSISSNPDDAMHLIEKQRFDCAIIDFQLGETDGISVTKKIREIPYGTDLPVVLMSAVKVNFKPDEKLLFSSVISKPVREQILKESLLKAIRQEVVTPQKPVKKKELTTRFKDARVLIVEDNLINQKVTSSLLNNMGIKPHIAENGIKAVEACRNNNYHLVLMDIQMPEMDGIEATRTILKEFKAAGKKPPVIIALTANVLGESRKQCLAAGMLGFITKPVSPPELEKVLTEWLGDFKVK